MDRRITMLLGAALLVCSGTAFAIRCGNELAEVGDLKHQVLLACGEPKSKEVIGYIDKEVYGDRIRVLIVEEWIVETNGSYYSLTFEGNTLVKITPAGKRK